MLLELVLLAILLALLFFLNAHGDQNPDGCFQSTPITDSGANGSQ